MNHLLPFRWLSACSCVLAVLSGCTGNARDSSAIETGDAASVRQEDASVPQRDDAMAPADTTTDNDLDAGSADATNMTEAAVREASVDGTLRADAAALDSSVAIQDAAQRDATPGDASPLVADSGDAALPPSMPVVEQLIAYADMPISERACIRTTGDSSSWVARCSTKSWRPRAGSKPSRC